MSKLHELKRWICCPNCNSRHSGLKFTIKEDSDQFLGIEIQAYCANEQCHRKRSSVVKF